MSEHNPLDDLPSRDSFGPTGPERETRMAEEIERLKDHRLTLMETGVKDALKMAAMAAKGAGMEAERDRWQTERDAVVVQRDKLLKAAQTLVAANGDGCTIGMLEAAIEKATS